MVNKPTLRLAHPLHANDDTRPISLVKQHLVNNELRVIITVNRQFPFRPFCVKIL